MVVETIDFYADEDAELPPPMTQKDVILLNRAGLEDEEAAPEEDTEAGKEGKVRNLASCMVQASLLGFHSSSAQATTKFGLQHSSVAPCSLVICSSVQL